jgi:hypothetical protein
MFALSQLFVEWAGGRVMWGRAASSWPGQPGKLPPSRVLLSFPLSHRVIAGRHIPENTAHLQKALRNRRLVIIHSTSLGSFSLWMKQSPVAYSNLFLPPDRHYENENRGASIDSPSGFQASRLLIFQRYAKPW